MEALRYDHSKACAYKQTAAQGRNRPGVNITVTYYTRLMLGISNVAALEQGGSCIDEGREVAQTGSH